MRSWTTTGSDWQPVRPTEASRYARRLALPFTRLCVADDDSTERAVKQTSRSRLAPNLDVQVFQVEGEGAAAQHSLLQDLKG